MMGLADDGGLLLPARIPQPERLDQWSSLSYAELATEIFSQFVGDEIPRQDLQRLVAASYQCFRHPEIVPTVQVGSLHVLELFHGPTLAFKDVALQFLGNLFEYILERRGGELNLLGATSGDTGSAAIHGVRGKRHIRIFIMHPSGRVSPIQERQMTTVLDENVHNLALTGSFDDGQRILKEIFSDLAFKRKYRLGAVNSVNWARVLAQIVYYFYAAFRTREQTGAATVQFCVPTGNFGDIFAGYLAWRMGAPISRLILATNENNILSRFFKKGIYEKGEVRQTLSPSMDIQVASNFERYLYYRLGEDGAAVRELLRQFEAAGRIELPGCDRQFAAGAADRQATLNTIRDYQSKYDYLLDPHTAVGVAVAERFQVSDSPTICLATAHPAKFPAAIEQALGRDIARHPMIADILRKESRCRQLTADRRAVQGYLESVLVSE